MVDRRDPDFDDFLDDRAEEFKIPEFYGPHPASYVFSRADPQGYREEALKWREGENFRLLERARQQLEDEPNASRFERLVSLARVQRLVPFVGAGLSIPAGFPGWRNFLILLASQRGWNTVEAEQVIDEQGYESLTSQLVQASGTHLFAERVEETFRSRDHPIRGPVRVLPKVVGEGFVVSTNFDDLVERSFARALGAPFRSRPSGRSDELNFEMVRSNDYCLLKLHGSADTPKARVLTPEEYDEAYGAEGTLDLSLPLPRFLDRVFWNHKLLFLGCSLRQDRTLGVFRKAAEVAARESDPIKHYAVIEKPGAPEQVAERERFLSDHCIFPIWYPEDDHEIVEGLLLLLEQELRSSD
jgi:hypothetical protein